MNMGLVDLKKIRDNIGNADFRGKSAYCFIDKNKIIKIYATKQDGDFIPVETSKICDFSMFKADTIVFPDEYIYENGKIVGEISRYIKNKPIDESINDNTRINKIIDAYEKVLVDLLTYSNIDMIDLCETNILYSNKSGFHIIDTTEWQLANNAYKLNVYRFNSSLIRVLIDYLKVPITYSKYYNRINQKYFDSIKEIGSVGMKLSDNLYKLMNSKYDFFSLLQAYIDACRLYYSKDIETFKEMKEFTKVLKKG